MTEEYASWKLEDNDSKRDNWKFYPKGSIATAILALGMSDEGLANAWKIIEEKGADNIMVPDRIQTADQGAIDIMIGKDGCVGVRHNDGSFMSMGQFRGLGKKALKLYLEREMFGTYTP